MTHLNIQANRKASKYSHKEKLKRVIWGIISVLFRLTPRPMFALRRMILSIFGAKIAAGVNIYPTAKIYMPWNLVIGKNSSIGEYAFIYNLGMIKIGSSVTISQRAHLCAGTHDYEDPKLKLLKLPIEIKDESWVCADAYVGPNVTIGEGAIIGARAVVTKDVEPWCIVAGNPSRFIKLRKMRIKE